MRPSDVAATVVTTLFGLLTGWLVAGVAGAIVLCVLGAVLGVVAARSNVRPAITTTVFVGAMAGVLVGASIVETICLPKTCVAAQLSVGFVVGVAAFIGVGLVAALVTRSFDEYNESVRSGTPPPSVGCETEPEPGRDQPG